MLLFAQIFCFNTFLFSSLAPLTDLGRVPLLLPVVRLSLLDTTIIIPGAGDVLLLLHSMMHFHKLPFFITALHHHHFCNIRNNLLLLYFFFFVVFLFKVGGGVEVAAGGPVSL